MSFSFPSIAELEAFKADAAKAVSSITTVVDFISQYAADIPELANFAAPISAVDKGLHVLQDALKEIP